MRETNLQEPFRLEAVLGELRGWLIISQLIVRLLGKKNKNKK